MSEQPNYMQKPYAFYYTATQDVGIPLERPNLTLGYIQARPWNAPLNDDHKQFIRSARQSYIEQTRLETLLIPIQISDRVFDPQLGTTVSYLLYSEPEFVMKLANKRQVPTPNEFTFYTKIENVYSTSWEKPDESDLKTLARQNNCAVVDAKSISYHLWSEPRRDLQSVAIVEATLVRKGNIRRISKNPKAVNLMYSRSTVLDRDYEKADIIYIATDSPAYFEQLNNGEADIPDIFNESLQKPDASTKMKRDVVTAADLWGQSHKEVAIPSFAMTFSQRPTAQEVSEERARRGLILQ